MSLIKVMKCGLLIDGTGKPPLVNAVVVIKDSEILEVGEDVQIPSGAQTIDADGMVIMPGLMNLHTHLASVEAPG